MAKLSFKVVSLFDIAVFLILFAHLVDGEQTIHVVFSNHVDLGFGGLGEELGFDNNVFNKFFDEHFPRAIRLANEMREKNPSRRLIWTTQPYLLSMFFDCPTGMGLHCPSKEQVNDVKAAINRGDITWHAMPHNAQVELFDAPLLRAAVGMAHQLDTLFSQPLKHTMSQRDVPGLTRAAIPILSAAGVQALSVGVNKGSAPPGVPHCTPFMWRDESSNSSLVAFWHPGGYGGKVGYLAVDSKEDCIITPGLDHVLCVAWRGDNSGPPANTSEIGWVYDHLEKEFPGANVQASTLDAFTEHLLQALPTLNLPTVTGEIGDTWIYGVASDPAKLADFRAVQRYRRGCLEAGFCLQADPAFSNFTRLLVKLPEHTWGLDTKQGLHDFDHWSNRELDECLGGQQNCKDMVTSWTRQYDYINWALEALGPEHEVSMAFKADWKQRHQPPPHHKPTWLDTARQLFSRQQQKAAALPQQKVLDWNSKHWKLRLDTAAGTFTHLQHLWPFSPAPTAGVNWAEGSGMFQIMYSTYTEASYDTVWQHYKYLPDLPWWYHADFGKPNVTKAHPKRVDVVPVLEDVYEAPSEDGPVVLMRYIFPPWAVTDAGAPEDMWIQMHVPSDSTKLQLVVGWKGKRPTRLPEALWFSVITPSGSSQPRPRRRCGSAAASGPTHWWRSWFAFGQRSDSGSHPGSDPGSDLGSDSTGSDGACEYGTSVDSKSWRLSKLGSWIDPLDVVLNGSQSMHAVDDDGVRVDSLPIPQPDPASAWLLAPVIGKWQFARRLAGSVNKATAEGKRSHREEGGVGKEAYRERLQIRSLDAALVSPGAPNPFPNPDRPPRMEEGVHFNLVNNIWGTNYIMWFPYAEDQNITSFRFEVQVSQLRDEQDMSTHQDQVA